MHKPVFAPGGQDSRAPRWPLLVIARPMAGLAEPRLGYAPRNSPVSFVQTYGFVDAAKVWNSPRAFGSRSAAFASARGGVRVNIRGRVTVRAELARPLTRTPFEQRSKAWRGFVSLWAPF